VAGLALVVGGGAGGAAALRAGRLPGGLGGVEGGARRVVDAERLHGAAAVHLVQPDDAAVVVGAAALEAGEVAHGAVDHRRRAGATAALLTGRAHGAVGDAHRLLPLAVAAAGGAHAAGAAGLAG